MITEVPFTVDRWKNIRLQPAQAHEPPSVGYADRLVAEGATWAYDNAEGQTVAAGGLYPVGPGQAVAWLYLDADSGRHMTALLRAMKRAIATHKDRWPTIRAAVLSDFDAGKRMMALLGFVPMLASEPIMFAGRVYTVFQKVHYGG